MTEFKDYFEHLADPHLGAPASLPVLRGTDVRAKTCREGARHPQERATRPCRDDPLLGAPASLPVNVGTVRVIRGQNKRKRHGTG